MVIDRSKSDILAEFESARDRDASCPVTEPTPSTSPTLHRSSSFTVVSQSCVQFQSGQSCLSFYDSSLTRPPACYAALQRCRNVLMSSIITGPPNGPVLFCSLASIGVVCRRL